jgi:uncharacterized membrane protein YeaQ/YmgE (transglycosylase-associated protein family)
MGRAAEAGLLLENAMFVGILGWLVVGFIVGFVASKMVNLRGDDPKLGIFAAVGGAFGAGVLHAMIGSVSVSAWNPWSVLVAVIGAVVGVVIWHIIRSRTISHGRQTVRSSY